MKKSKYFVVSLLLLGAYLLSACSGATPVPSVVDDSSNGQLQEIVFTGTVEAMGDGQWQISGQTISVDTAASIDAGVQVGDIVRVEANVSSDGSVVALRIEASALEDGNVNTNDANTNDDDTNTNDNTNTGDNGNDNGNMNSNDDPAGSEQEIFGVVDAITTDAITINGIPYSIADFAEFNDVIAVGDQVKIHVIVNADGTLTIREIEKSDGSGDDNGNSNGNSNDDNSNDDDNSNGNSNDDDSNDNGDDHNSNDDDSNDNGDDHNSNDGDDNNSNDD